MRIYDRISPCSRLLLVSLLALPAGCTRDLPVAPSVALGPASTQRSGVAEARAVRQFYPLAIGNWWHAVADDRAVAIPSDGGPPVEQFTVHTEVTRELIGTEEISGRPYTLQREDHVSTSSANPNPSTYTTWVRYRQDADGLFEAETTAPPAGFATRATDGARGGALRAFPAAWRARMPGSRAAAFERAWTELGAKIASLERALAGTSRVMGVLPGEITRLEYPLHPGAEWTIRTDPSFWCDVEGVDQLRLEAGRFTAYRLRIRNEFMGSSDRVHLWIGRAGQLQLVYQLVTVATDENGNEIGRVVVNHQEAVDQLSLVRP